MTYLIIIIIIIGLIIIIKRTGWTFCATVEGASYKTQMITARAPSSFSDYPF